MISLKILSLLVIKQSCDDERFLLVTFTLTRAAK